MAPSKRQRTDGGSSASAKRQKSTASTSSALQLGFARQIERSPKKRVQFARQLQELDEDDIEDSDDDGRVPLSDAVVDRSARVQRGTPSDDRPAAQINASSMSDAFTQTATPWTELMPPVTADQLAVNPKKVAEVRHWLRNAMLDPAHHAMLILSGPAGAGKTATVQVLARELGYGVLEWHNPMSDPLDYSLLGRDHEGLVQKFDRFLAVGNTYSELQFGEADTTPERAAGQQLIVVEDLPNVFSAGRDLKGAFQESLARYVCSSHRRHPLVLIVTEVEPRSEYASSRSAEALTVRTLLPRWLTECEGVANITFKEIAKTFMSKALIRLVDGLPQSQAVDMSTALLDEVAEHTNGDIRAAFNALQFIAHRFSTHGRAPRKRPKRKRGEASRLTADEQRLLSIVTNRDNALGFFHAMGKLVYNKRGHPSRPDDDPTTIVEECGTEPGFFLLGVARNYTDSCTTVEQAAGVVDALSWSDGCAKAALWSQTRDYATLVEIATYGAVAGVQQALPHNAKRSHAAKLFFPNLAQVRREAEVTDLALDRALERPPRACAESRSTYLLERASDEAAIAAQSGQLSESIRRALAKLTKFDARDGQKGDAEVKDEEPLETRGGGRGRRDEDEDRLAGELSSEAEDEIEEV